jgi:hypothetical protein
MQAQAGAAKPYCALGTVPLSACRTQVALIAQQKHACLVVPRPPHAQVSVGKTCLHYTSVNIPLEYLPWASVLYPFDLSLHLHLLHCIAAYNVTCLRRLVWAKPYVSPAFWPAETCVPDRHSLSEVPCVHNHVII